MHSVVMWVSKAFDCSRSDIPVALQKPFCQHSLLQALECFHSRHSPWRYVEAYINYALAQQAYIAGEAHSASKYFTALLGPGEGLPYQAGILKDASLASQVGVLILKAAASDLVP